MNAAKKMATDSNNEKKKIGVPGLSFGTIQNQPVTNLVPALKLSEV